MAGDAEPPKPKWPWILGGLVALISIAMIAVVVIAMFGALFLVRREQQSMHSRHGAVQQQWRTADARERRARFDAEQAARRARLQAEQADERLRRAAEDAERARRAAEAAANQGVVHGTS